MHRDKHVHEIGGVFFILIALLVCLSFASYNSDDIARYATHRPVSNLIGPFGVWLSHIVRSVFGVSSYLMAALFANVGYLLIKNEWKDTIVERACSYIILMVSTSAFFSLIVPSPLYLGGGYVGQYEVQMLSRMLGTIGTYIVIVLFNVIALIFSGIVTLSQIQSVDLKATIARIAHACRSFMTRKGAGKLFPEVTTAKQEKGRRLPWITKKRVLVLETEKLDDLYALSGKEESPLVPIHYLEMNVEEKSDSITNTTIPDVPVEVAMVSGQEIELDSYNDYYDKEISDADSIPCSIDGEELVDTDDSEFDEREEHNDVEEENAIVAKYAATKREKGISAFGNESIYEEIPINREYIIPTSFLTSSIPVDTESWQNEVRKNSMLLVNTLAEFGVDSKVINVNKGPVLTLYEVQIAPGIKVNKIVGLADDIAMALAASRVRVVAPIPGKSAIGVEIPNRERETVTLGDIIKSDEYQKHHGSLKVGLGKDILGKPVIIDLKKLPHLLIAGATGSGKSVCVNSIITSLIYNYDPNYVRFILIDPKMVELQLYDGLPHLLTPVITDVTNTPQALRWTMFEMERRYRLLSELNTRDIERYNQKVVSEKLTLERLPFIVAIIDELADLMMVALKEVEGYITRIAQKARAVGIHLVFATQRPSVDIITGIIKANIPARIAFQVAQKTDSRTIIDQNGAEKLLGKGDMLYQSPLSSFPTRIQGALIIEEEIIQIASYLKKLGKPSYIDIEECSFEDEMSKNMDEVDDELFVEALKIVEETKKASASYLQRRLSIGYNRAARIIEQMEDLGYVGPQQGSKPREVFI